MNDETGIHGLVSRHPGYCAMAALFLLAAIWGYNWVVMKVALADCGPFTFAALRTSIGGLALVPLLLWKEGLRFPRQILKIAILGVVQTGCFLGLTCWALVEGGAGKTAVLVYTMPFWLLILARFWLGERMVGIQRLAVFLSFIGMILIFDPWHRAAGFEAEVLAVLSGLAWAVSVILAKRLQRKEPVPLLQLTTWQMLIGSVPLIIAALILREGPVSWSPSFIWALVYNIIPSNAVAWLLWLFILEKLPAGIAGIGSLAIPLVGVASAWIQLGEVPVLIEAAGMLLIALALLSLSIFAIARR